MDYLYLNFDDNVSELLGGGVYTGTKLFLFKATDFPDAAGIQVSGLAGTKSNVMNMISIDGKLNNKGYYVDSSKLNQAKLIMSNVEIAKRTATMASFEVALRTVLSFIKQDNKEKVERDIKRRLTNLPSTIDIASLNTSNFANNKDEVSKQLIAHLRNISKLPIDTVVMVTFGILSNVVMYTKTFTEQELAPTTTEVAKEQDNVRLTFN